MLPADVLRERASLDQGVERDAFVAQFLLPAEGGTRFEGFSRARVKVAQALSFEEATASATHGSGQIFDQALAADRLKAARSGKPLRVRQAGEPVDSKNTLEPIMNAANSEAGVFLTQSGYAHIQQIAEPGRPARYVMTDPSQGAPAGVARISGAARLSVDLVNQRILAAALEGRESPYASAELTRLAAQANERLDRHRELQKTFGKPGRPPAKN